MTGDDFREARLRLGLSFRDMATALGMPPASKRKVRRYEAEGPPPRIAERAEELLRQLGRKEGGND